MDPEKILTQLDLLTRRIDEVVTRIEKLERGLTGSDELREQLEHEREARRRLGDQTQWLIELLGDARKKVRHIEREEGGVG